MEKGKTMTRRGLALGRQIATFAALAALALSLSGDRTSAAGVPAPVYGQDPLEVLELKVRPNVIVVLDSSGSMQWLVDENDYAQSGDHPRSKLYQAKQVLKQAVQNNQDKVSFQMGTYTQYSMGLPDRAVGRNRFQYTVSSTDAPFMATAATELTAMRAVGDGTTNRGLQSWQIIDPKWGTLYFEEDAATDAVCTATLTGLPKFYASGAALATDLTTAMTGATCTGSSKTNTYNVAYSATNGRFTFSRASGSRNFRIVWGRTPNNIRNALAETSTTTSAWATVRPDRRPLDPALPDDGHRELGQPRRAVQRRHGHAVELLGDDRRHERDVLPGGHQPTVERRGDPGELDRRGLRDGLRDGADEDEPSLGHAAVGGCQLQPRNGPRGVHVRRLPGSGQQPLVRRLPIQVAAHPLRPPVAPGPHAVHHHRALSRLLYPVHRHRRPQGLGRGRVRGLLGEAGRKLGRRPDELYRVDGLRQRLAERAGERLDAARQLPHRHQGHAEPV